LKIRVSVSIPHKLLRSIDELTRKKRTKRSTLLNEAIGFGFRELRIDFAVEQCDRGLMSVYRAAELAQIGLAEFLEEMRKRGHTPHYDLESLMAGAGESDPDNKRVPSDSPTGG
jgi:predicted HTH domain antitoxin